MAKLLVLFALCAILPLIAVASVPEPFIVKGACYCDTCRVGYETTATQYIPGCIVKLVCKKRDSPKAKTYEKTAKTDSTGHYQMEVPYEAGDDICEVAPIHSPDPLCNVPNGGRDKARVCLTRNNGMVSNVRFANNLGYSRKVPLSNCPQVLQQYQDTESYV